MSVRSWDRSGEGSTGGRSITFGLGSGLVLY